MLVCKLIIVIELIYLKNNRCQAPFNLLSIYILHPLIDTIPDGVTIHIVTDMEL